MFIIYKPIKHLIYNFNMLILITRGNLFNYPFYLKFYYEICPKQNYFQPTKCVCISHITIHII